MATGVTDPVPTDDDCATIANAVDKDHQTAYYACRYFAAVKQNAQINATIAGIQQVASLYLADKQYEVAKQAQDRLDDTWADQKDKGDKLFNHWFDNSRLIEIGMLEEARARERDGYIVDYETAKNRVTSTVRSEFGRQRQRLEREASIHCTGATRQALRQLASAEARAIATAVNGAYRAEEARKDLKEAGYREEVYKWNGLFRGVIGDSLNASKSSATAAMAASKIDPYAGWASSVGGLSNVGNALGNLNMASSGAAQQFYNSYGNNNMGSSNLGVAGMAGASSMDIGSIPNSYSGVAASNLVGMPDGAMPIASGNISL